MLNLFRRTLPSFDHALSCDVCEAIAWRAHTGTVWYTDEHGVVISGLVNTRLADIRHAKTIDRLLNANRIAALHRFLIRKKIADQGIDAYCPECDRIYCGKHYTTSVSFDDGFYDCTDAVCPQGHSRTIDD